MIRKCVKPNRKIQWLHILVLLTIPAVLFILQRSGGYLAGSSVDWISQHTVFPDYFRELFYETGRIVPSYAAELGGGQNIYNFAYYGLCNPLYWIAYLLPFVKMSTYIQVLSFVLMTADGVFCYVWLSDHFERTYSFFASLSLMLALPVVYHSTAQLMFVNYLPFLILALIGYDRYCRTSKYGLMTGSIVLMILVSFYFAPGGFAALFLYGVSGYKKQQIPSASALVRSLWHRFYPAVLAGFLSMFYLVPVFCAMRAGRSGGEAVSVKELLVPDVGMNKFLYSPYGLGLTAVVVIGVCTSLFYKMCREKRLGILLAAVMVFPVFSWILNGGLYIRDKALIPMLPLVFWLFAGFLQRLGKKELSFLQTGGGYALAAAMLYIGSVDLKEYQQHLLYLDLAVCAVVLFVLQQLWYRAVCLATAVMLLSGVLVSFYARENTRISESYAGRLESEETGRAVEELLRQSGGLCRIETRGGYEYNKDNLNRVRTARQNLTTCYSSVSNGNYQDFRREIGLNKLSRNSLMQDTLSNPLFLRFMGVKYLVGQTDTKGYRKIEGSQDTGVYENAKAAPLFYLTDQTISEKQYQKLSWAGKQLTLLQNAVTDGSSGDTAVELGQVEADFSGVEGAPFTWADSKLRVNTKEDVTRTVHLSRPAGEDTYLFLSFSVKNRDKNHDMMIKVNGEQNKLSGLKRVYYNGNEVFHYTCAVPKGTKEITVDFGEGCYEISRIQGWFGTVDEEKNDSLYQEKPSFVRSKEGDGYTGTCKSSADKWLITSIPYDDHFQISIDGKPVKKEKVNRAFLGARIEKGTHRIRISYRTPGKAAGIALSGITLLILAADYIRRNRSKYEGNRGEI